jgi:hypothetical protein
MSERCNVTVPPVSELRTLDRPAAIELLGEVERGLEELIEARGALRAVLLEPPAPPPLLDVRETARRLNMSEEWVRQHGAELDIEAYVSDGVHRYDPIRVDGLRERRRPRR